MTSTRLAKRYATGLWDYALVENKEDTIIDEIKLIIQNIEENRHFQLFLKSPIIETSKKIQIAKEIFKSFSPITLHFVILILKHKRENILLDISKEVLKVHDEYKGIQRIEIISAIPLDQNTISKILLSEAKIDPQKAIVENIIDESLIGGYILRLEDVQVDASVKTRLSNIKKRLSEKVY